METDLIRGVSNLQANADEAQRFLLGARRRWKYACAPRGLRPFVAGNLVTERRVRNGGHLSCFVIVAHIKNCQIFVLPTTY